METNFDSNNSLSTSGSNSNSSSNSFERTFPDDITTVGTKSKRLRSYVWEYFMRDSKTLFLSLISYK